jgi:hypothetical protein
LTGKFDKELVLPEAGDMTVSGPLIGDGDEDAATVHFLIVQGEGDDTVLAIGQGKWERGGGTKPNPKWSATLPVDAGRHPDGKPGGFRTGKVARGIGLAIAVKPGSVENGEFDPPSFQALTWCADFKFVEEAGAAA